MIAGIIAGYVLASGGGQALFDPDAKDATLAISSDRISVSPVVAEGAGFVLCDTPKTAGKFYVELILNSIGGSDQSLGGGIITGEPSSYASYIGGQPNGYGSWVIGPAGNTRCTFQNGSQGSNVGSTPISAGSRLRIAVDITAGKLWLSYWGGTAWIGGGSPDAGTSPTFSFAPGASCRFGTNPRGSGAVSSIVAVDDWASAAPSGYGVWEA